MYSNLESVEQLFRQYYKVLRVYAFRFVNDWDIAEDVVQDVFVALWNEVTKRVYFIGNERMLIDHDSNRLRFS